MLSLLLKDLRVYDRDLEHFISDKKNHAVIYLCPCVWCYFLMSDLVLVVLVVGVVRVSVEGVVEDIPGGAVENMYMILVEEGEVLIMLEKINKMIAVTIQLVMAG